MYNSLCHTDDRKYCLGLSLTQNKREACTINLMKELGQSYRVSCWKKILFYFILSWDMISSMVKPELFNHLELVYHFRIPLKSAKKSNF